MIQRGRWAYQTAITNDAATVTEDHSEPSEDIGSAVSDLIRN